MTSLPTCRSPEVTRMPETPSRESGRPWRPACKRSKTTRRFPSPRTALLANAHLTMKARPGNGRRGFSGPQACILPAHYGAKTLGKRPNPWKTAFGDIGVSITKLTSCVEAFSDSGEVQIGEVELCRRCGAAETVCGHVTPVQAIRCKRSDPLGHRRGVICSRCPEDGPVRSSNSRLSERGPRRGAHGRGGREPVRLIGTAEWPGDRRDPVHTSSAVADHAFFWTPSFIDLPAGSK
jgi:hypothetical protein